MQSPMRRERQSNFYLVVFVVITAILILAQVIVQSDLHEQLYSVAPPTEDIRVQAVWDLRNLEAVLSGVTLLSLAICVFLLVQPHTRRLQRTLIALKTAQQALQQAEVRYRLLAQHSRDAIALHQPDGRLNYVNPAFVKMTGYAEVELMAMSPATLNALAAPEDRKRISDGLHPQLLQGNPVSGIEYRLQRKDGVYIWVETHAVPVFDAKGQVEYILATTRDMSERKHGELEAQVTMEALLESEKRFSSAFNNSPVPMAITTTNDDYPAYIEVNEAYLSLVGWTWEELRGRSVLELGIAIPSAERDSRLKALRDEEQYTMREAQIRTRSGAIRDIIISAQRIKIDGQEFDIEILLDITERKLNALYSLEIERLKSLFQQDEEQKHLVRRTISTLSHDLRTPLAIISTSKDTLSRYADHLTPAQRQAKLDAIGRQVQFIREMLDDLGMVMNDSLKAREFKPAPVNIVALCQVSVDGIRAMNSGSHTILFDNRGSNRVVQIDEVLVSRILVNLLTNAVKYSPDGGKVCLILEDGLQGGQSLVLRVTDEGIGIAQKDLPHVFDAYYRVKTPHHIDGSGLGLHIVKDCVQRHGGQIFVESEVGKGTTFTVTLPLTT